MKKIISLVLALMLVFSMASAALAAVVTPTVDAAAIEAGSDVTLTLTLDETLNDVTSLEYRVFYDAEKYTLKSSAKGNANDKIVISDIAKTDKNGNTYYAILLVDDTAEGLVVSAGTLYTLTFTAIANVAAETVTSFNASCYEIMDTSWTTYQLENAPAVTVTIEPPVVLVPATSAAIEVEGYEDLSSGITMTVGKSAVITAALSPEDTTDMLSLASDNESVAKIENGKLVAVAAGSATITAKAMIDGENEREDVSASFTVTVEEEEEAINGLTAALYNAQAEVVNGDQIVVDLMMQSDKVEKYNAFDITINYDAEKLEFVKAEFAVPEKANDYQKHDVSDNGEGTLTVYGYGEAYNASASNALVHLTFKGIENGPANVSVGAAFANDRAEAIKKQPINEIEKSETKGDSDVMVYQNYTITFEGATVMGSETTLQYRTDDSDGKLYFSVDDTVIGHDVDTVTVANNAATVEQVEGNNYVLSNITGDVTVNITLKKETYAVTFSGAGAANVNGGTAQTATYKEGFSFTVTEESGYKYSYTVTVGGKEVSYTTVSEGSYKIDAEYVTGPISIVVGKVPSGSIDSFAVKTYQNGTKVGKDGVVVENAPNYSFTYDADKYVLDQVTIGGVAVQEGNMTDDNGSVLISQTITGEVHIMLLSKYDVTLPEGVSGNDYAVHDKDYTFTLKEGYVLVSVTTADGTKLTLTPDANGVYTIPGNKVTGVFTIETQEIEGYTAELFDFVQWDEKTVKLVLVKAGQNTANPLTYDGNEMFYSSEYAGYAYLVLLGEGDETLAPEVASEKVELSSDTAKKNPIAYVNDVNLSGASDINDAQLVYDIYTAHYDTIDAVGMEQLLSADVDGKKAVDTQDIAQIINAKYRTASN